MRHETAIPHAEQAEHAPSSKLKDRPLWRRRLVLAGAACLLLAGIGLCIASQRTRLASGIAVATPQLHMAGWRAERQGFYLFYEKGQCYGIALSQRGVRLWGFSIQSRTKLQGNELYAFAPWWAFMGLVSVPVVLAARDVAIGMRLERIAGRLCENCGYDLRATPDRCPECGTVCGRPVAA
jgi:hypothetical protein